ncbi:BTAD domain-containing putative transcriptional regulator [Microbacterium sp. ARD31]|uniref:AfsR/SARP family transcriptional regulator n=1 Tax=Microbacterium sp. ARD31 TaxID=2962576 RepID=UPI002880C8F5|nr:BTAD domain-containing putative transcriptional regulator [Microbacterium sp. ARD31]MDT0185037.1 BTAD domain-containing putative transcriptional regulator [Microbacterium sp. ARD31]
MVLITVLGPVTAVSDGAELPLGGPRRRSVLAGLALSHPRPSTVDDLVDQLWGELPPASVRNAVQVNVTTLRKLLRAHGVDIARVGDGYVLTGDVEVDARTFEHLVSAGRAALRAGDPGRSAELFDRALDLWSGAPLSGIDAEGLLQAARPGLEQTRATALAELGDARLRIRDEAGAATAAHTLLEAHPYDERGWSVLAQALYWSGQQAEALGACAQARRVLRDDLGVDPTPALQDLETAILRHALPERAAPADAGPAVDDPEPDGATFAPLPALPEPFVGRQEEVAEALHLLGHGRRTLTLVGIGGMGKTTLATVVAHELAAAGTPVAFCRLETEVTAAAALARVAREVGVDPNDDDLVAAVATRVDGAVLVLDNLEGVDGVRGLVDALGARAPGLRLLLTSRRPTGAAGELTLLLAPLAPEHAVELFVHRAEQVRPGIGAADRGAVRELCQLVDGIPLALEVAAARVRTFTPGQLVERFAQQRTSPLAPSPSRTGPRASLLDVLAESHAALGEPARRTFELLGSFRGWVSLELLEAAADGMVHDLEDALEELVSCGLVSLDLEGRAAMREPVRQFARTRGERTALDERLRRAALGLAEDTAAGLFGPTAGASVARLARDHDTLDVALTDASAAGDAESGARLAVALHRYWLLTGRLAEGHAVLHRLVSTPPPDPAQAVRVAVLAGTFASYLNQTGTQAQLEEALGRAAALGLEVDRIVVNGWCCLAAFAAHHGDLPTARSAAARAAELASSSNQRQLVSLARDVEGHVAAYAGDHETSLRANLQSLAEARDEEDTYDVVHLLLSAAVDLLYLDRADQALHLSTEAFDRVATLDVGPLLGSVLLVHGSALVVAGQPVTARASLLEALRITRERYPDPLASADILCTLGACATHQLDDATAARCYGAADAAYDQHGVAPQERLAPAIVAARRESEQRLPDGAFAVLAALGSGDTARTVDLLLDDSVDLTCT